MSNMQLPLAGYWQISPLTDLTIPQNDLAFPAPLSAALPSELAEDTIAEQEWHLMHDIELDESMLAHPAIDLIVGGVDFFAEVRINGEAVFDCDGTQLSYRKDIKRYLRPGRNRFEILFLEQEEDFLLDDEIACPLGSTLPQKRDRRMGLWEVPFLHFVPNVRLDYIATEQIWHQEGGCEFRVDLFYQVYSPGLVSARVKFNGMTLAIPLDIRSQKSSALFQVDAPLSALESKSNYYILEVELDGQKRTLQVELSPDKCAEHYPA